MSVFFGTKPELVQAIQWRGNNGNAIREFGGASVSVLNAELIEVRTDKGPFLVRIGEYLLQTESGFMVCPESVFALAFEAVDAEEIEIPPAAPEGVSGHVVTMPNMPVVPSAAPGAEPPAVFEPVPPPVATDTRTVAPAAPPAIVPDAPPAPPAAPVAEAPIIPADAMAPAPVSEPAAPTEPPFTSTPQ